MQTSWLWQMEPIQIDTHTVTSATFILIQTVGNYNSTANRFGAQDNRLRLLCYMDIAAEKVLITFLEPLFLHIWY